MPDNKPTANQPTTDVVLLLTTKQVAATFGMKPIQLRRILRSMPRYNDGIHTNYRWDPKDKQALGEIKAVIDKRRAATAPVTPPATK